MRWPTFRPRDPSRPVDVVAAQLELERAAAIGRIAESAQVSPGRGRDKWGSFIPEGQFTAGMNEQNVIHVGPFPEPRCIRLQAAINPPVVASLVNTPPQPTCNWRIVRGFGDAALSETRQQLPSVVVAQSLDVFVARRAESGATQALSLNVWACPTPELAAPVIIAFEQTNLGIGVAQVALTPPPREATHVAMSAPSTSNAGYYIAWAGPNLTGRQRWRMTDNNFLFYGPAPIPSEANSWQVERTATADNANPIVYWLRA